MELGRNNECNEIEASAGDNNECTEVEAATAENNRSNESEASCTPDDPFHASSDGSEYQPSTSSTNSNNSYVNTEEYSPSRRALDFEICDNIVTTTNNKSTQTCSENERIIGCFNVEMQTETVWDDVTTTTSKQLSVAAITNRSKKWNKNTCCIYCNKLIVKLARHLEQMHSEEEDVKKFLLLPKLCKERKGLISEIRKRGNYVHNTNAMKNEDGTILVKRRQNIVDKTRAGIKSKRNTTKCLQNSVKLPKTASDFMPCPKCLGFYYKNTFFLHYKTCDTTVNKYSRVKHIGETLLPPLKGSSIHLQKHILPAMRDTIITKNIKNDSLILKFGSYLCVKYIQQTHLKNFIRQKMIQLAKLKLSILKMNENINSLIKIIDPQFFNVFIDAINDVGKLNKITGEYGIPSLVTALGTSVKKCANLLIGDAIQNEDIEMKRKVEDFIKLYDLHFTNLVSRNAVNNIAHKKWNTPDKMPITADIEKLNSYLKKKEQDFFFKLQEKFTYEAWDSLSKCTLARILLFNRRRVGEMERLQIADFEKRNSISTDSDIYKSLSAVEKVIASRYVRIEIRGKLGRAVPILLSENQVTIIKHLLNVREFAYVSKANPYVFGRRDENHLNASAVLKQASNSCGAKHPDLLTGTRLRKQIATISQVLCLTESEMGHLADYMGHDLNVHKHIYRLPTDAIQLGKISKLLIALEEGKIHLNKGKTLDNMELGLEILTDKQIKETVICEEEESIEKAESSDTPEEPRAIQVPEDLQALQAPAPPVLTKLLAKNIPKKKKYCYIPKNTPKKRNVVQRRHWSTPEVKVVKEYFTNKIVTGTLPTLRQCREVIEKEPALQNRKAEQLKSFISNLKKKRKENN